MIASLIFIFTVISVLNDTKHNTGFRNPKLIISLLNDYCCFKAKVKPQNSISKTSTYTPKKKKKTNTRKQKRPRKENIFQVISSLKGVHSYM